MSDIELPEVDVTLKEPEQSEVRKRAEQKEVLESTSEVRKRATTPVDEKSDSEVIFARCSECDELATHIVCVQNEEIPWFEVERLQRNERFPWKLTCSLFSFFRPVLI